MSLPRVFQRALAALSDDYRGHPERPGEANETFEQFRNIRTLYSCRLALLIASFNELLFLPTDFWVFDEDPSLLRSIITVRLVFAALGFTGWFILRRTPPARVAPVVLAITAVLVAYGFGHLGMVVGPESPLICMSFFMPTVTVIFLFPLRERVVVTTSMSLITMLAFYGPHPEYLAYPHNGVIWVFASFATMASIVAGNVRYRLEEESFHQRQQIRQHAHEQEELNRLKDSFVATVSHELRTPLNAIIGLTEEVREKPDAPQVPEYLATVHRSSEGLLLLIDDILDLAKVKAGRLELAVEPVSIQSLVDDAAGLFAVECRRKGLALRVDVAPDLPPALADRGRLRQVLLNLLGNAVKFADRGGIRVSASLKDDGAAPMLVLEVADTGPGIPEDKRAHVFEAFTQLDATPGRRRSGTGLGLPIVRQLARLMGGDVAVLPNSPTGSVFRVEVPFARAPSRPEVRAPAPESSATPILLGDRVRRVLVADDVAENRLLVEVFLRHQPLEVTFVETGAMAVEAFRDRAFDLAFIDIEMPDLDGYAAVAQMRDIEGRSGRAPVPIIALTAHGLQEHRRRSEDAGFTRHVTKPLRKKELLAIIAQHLGTAEARESAAG